MRKLLSILIIFFLLCPVIFFGQKYLIEVKHFNIEDGLSHRNVHFALQDQHGYIWFGTDYGLNRFDGYNFKWITKEKHGLKSNFPKRAIEDKDGLLWLCYGQVEGFSDKIAIIDGIDIFDPISEKVASFEDFFEKNIGFQLSDVIHFSKKENGDLVFLTKDQRLIDYSGSGQFSETALENKYDVILTFYAASNGNYWMQVIRENTEKTVFEVVTVNEGGEEIFSFPMKNDKLDRRAFFYQTDGNPNQKWISLYSELENKKGDFQFYEANSQGELIPNKDATLYEPFNLDFSLFGRIARMADKGYVSCFVSNDGFYLVEKKDAFIYRLEEQYKDLRFANHILFDNQNKIWVSTQFGIYLITLKKNQFTKILIEEGGLFPTRGMGLDKNNKLWFIEESTMNFWVAQLNESRKSTISLGQINNPEFPDRVPFEAIIYELYLSPEGNLYYPSATFKLAKFNVEDFSLSHFKPVEKQSKNTQIWSLHRSSDNEIWAGFNSGGIGLFDQNESKWLSLSDDENFQCFTYQFIEKENAFWIITDAGIFLFDKNSQKTLERYWAGGEGKFKLPFDNLRHAYLEEDSRTFWLGTGGNGMIRFDIETGDYQQFTKADGLSNNVIYAIYSDDFGNLWLTSDYGIMRFNKMTHQVNTYLTKDGITHNEFNRVSHHKAEDGTLFFGSLKGITVFHPKDFQTDSSDFTAPLVINQFQQFVGEENQLVDKTLDLLSNPTITLAPDDPFFRLEFGLLTYEDVDKIQYAYKVEGQDLDWNYQKENYIRMSRLPYGNHVIRIKGQASDGQWSLNELSVKVAVLKPFYMEIWFLAFVLFALFGTGFLIYKLRTSQLKQQKRALETEVKRRTKTIREQAEQLKSLEKLKSRFFANVSHELRTPLTLMLGPISKLKKGDLPKEKAGKLIDFIQNNGNHLLKLVNEILDLSKLETNRLEIKETQVNFYDFLQPLIAQFKSAGDSLSLNLHFEYHADQSLNIALDIGKFEKIVHNFLSNAIKFTPEKGTVKLIVEDKENQLLVKVSDTGTGIHPDDLPHIFDRFYQSKQPDATVQGGTGIGLSLCKELAELLNGRVWAESELGLGSVFYFEFPKKETVDGGRWTGDGLPSPALPTPKGEFQPATANLDDSAVEAAAGGDSPSGVRGAGEGSPSAVHRLPSTVLIVEDNPELREYLTVILSEEYNTVTAENGKAAWDLLNASLPPDPLKGELPPTYPEAGSGSPFRGSGGSEAIPQLIISDLMMPVMDGFQFLEKVKAHDSFRHIPVIMLTARADVRVKLRALRIGVDDYLVKPFVEEELKIRIENLLRNYEERVAAHYEQDDQHSNAEQPVMAAVDMEWLEEVEKIYLEFINDGRLNIDFVAEKMFLSGRQFHRKLKQITGLTPNNYLQEIRLSQAFELIQSHKYSTIKETCHAVGFSSVKHFSKIFRKRFGMSPSEAFK